jgi:hypothetical protein
MIPKQLYPLATSASGLALHLLYEGNNQRIVLTPIKKITNLHDCAVVSNPIAGSVDNTIFEKGSLQVRKTPVHIPNYNDISNRKA